jgi:chromosome segregation protein
MPARLKSFTLHGYKTFATNTEFLFADGITAIVGPNGSGKSNIADAIRWVLGEQSYGLLRGKRTEDMIFAGSEQRSRAGMAQASVVFDNSDGWLPIDFSEVAITRRAFRDGENEYLLNNQKVRLKDVSELLAKSGLAERTYTIIGQGLVDAALALKAEERRRLFEEAAGIGLYRSRREEALRRLDTTRRNLERVLDILSELQPRLRSLERQAKRAQEYDQVRASLRELLKEWYGYHWRRAQHDYTEAQLEARKQEIALVQAQQAQADQDVNLNNLRQQLQTVRGDLNIGYKQLADLQQKQESTRRGKAVAQERIRLLSQQRDESEAEYFRKEAACALSDEQILLSKSECERMQAELAVCKERLHGAEHELQQTENIRLSIETKVKNTRALLIETTNRQAHLEARLEEKKSNQGRQEIAIESEQAEISRFQKELQDAQEKITAYKLQIDLDSQVLKAAEEDCRAAQAAHKNAEQEYKGIQQERSDIETQLTRLTTKADILEQAQKNLTGYADGAQLLLRSTQSQNVIGVVGVRLLVPDEYELAISSALGEYVEAVVYKDSSSVDISLDLLKDNATRGAILPVDALSPQTKIKIDPSKAPVEKSNIHGVASDLVQYPPEFRDVIDLLLGQVIVVKDRKTARALLASSHWRALPGFRAVTLSGELFSVNGTIVAGPIRKGILSRPRQLRGLNTDIVDLGNQLNSVTAKSDAAADNLIVYSKRVSTCLNRLENAKLTYNELIEKNNKLLVLEDNLQKNLNWHIENKTKLDAEFKLDQNEQQLIAHEVLENLTSVNAARDELRQLMLTLEDIDNASIQAQYTQWKTKCAVIEQAVGDTERRYNERVVTFGQAKNELDAIKQHIEKITRELNDLVSEQGAFVEEERILNNEIETLRSRLGPLEGDINKFEEEQDLLFSKDLEARQRFRSAEHSHAQAKILLVRRQEALDALRRRIEDDFGLVAFEYVDSVSGPKPFPLDGMVEKLPQVKEISPEMEEIIHQQRSLLKRMGPINPEAQNEYDEVLHRHSFMSDQVSDLKKAEVDIQEVIAELDLLMQREFRRTFDAVAQEFRGIFSRLFNGGMARLVLTEPENITDTGIDIEAKLPGRREQGLSLLSGGERSLTAVALVFALLKISPTPFCILDEVDAMLDEANVGRFREMLGELSANTQFIVITHNRNTVQAAGVIYGITMGRDSSSQVISLRLDEVSEEYGV